MPELTKALANRHVAQQDVLEDIHYLEGTGVAWVELLHDWYDPHGPA